MTNDVEKKKKKKKKKNKKKPTEKQANQTIFPTV